eukprot:jgi/Pico_ML_1/55736/g1383.t1
MAASVAESVTFPVDMTKTRMQLHPERTTSWNMAARIAKDEGLVNLGELTTYDTAKRYLLDKGWKDNLTTHTTSAIVSGFFATAFSCPADVVKSRIMAADAQGKYSGTIDCLVKTVPVASLDPFFVA